MNGNTAQPSEFVSALAEAVPVRLTVAPEIGVVPSRLRTFTIARPSLGAKVPGGGVTRLASSTTPFVAFELTAETIRRFAAVLELFEQLIGPPLSTTQVALDVTV